MNEGLIASQLIPLAGMLLLLLIPGRESVVAFLSLWVTRAMGASILTLLILWGLNDFQRHEFEWFILFREGSYEFPIIFFFDAISASYLFCTWLIFSIIVRYCRHYLHREPGYRRFFLTIFGFVFGLNIVILSGTLDMFFAGWEIVGVSSFLLIAFYRHRYQPIRNALRAYSIYRLCDFGLLLAALLIDLLLAGHNHFSELTDALKVNVPPGGYIEFFGLSLLLVIAASGKSAQFPFCFWIPRAMEGPTPSSAIFYGALSVHLGVFLLLRTQAIWGFELASRLIVLTIGTLTIIVAGISEKAQSNIKGQIAYASIVQVGFMFVELAFGLDYVVVTHFMGNAFLRCYQLLISPSVVSHLLRLEANSDVVFDIRATNIARSLPITLRATLPETLQNTLLVVSLQEFNLDTGLKSLLWDPFRKLGQRIGKSPHTYLGIPLIALLLIAFSMHRGGAPFQVPLAACAALGMFFSSTLAFSQKHAALMAWNLVSLSSLLGGITTWLSDDRSGFYVGLFFSGILPAWILGLACLLRMQAKSDPLLGKFTYHGMSEKSPKTAIGLFLAFLIMAGFPISPGFLGQDLVLYHLSGEHAWLAPLVAVSLVLNGISVSGIFMRLCAGRPVESRREFKPKCPNV